MTLAEFIRDAFAFVGVFAVGQAAVRAARWWRINKTGPGFFRVRP